MSAPSCAVWAEVSSHFPRPRLARDRSTLGILSPPYVINLVFHTPTQGGTRGTAENLLDAVGRIRALGSDVRINVSSMGPTQLPLTTIALAMGLNIRVGMEDNVLYRRGEPLRDNAQLVERAVRIGGSYPFADAHRAHEDLEARRTTGKLILVP